MQSLDIPSVIVLGKCPLRDCEGWSGLMLWPGCPEKIKTSSWGHQWHQTEVQVGCSKCVNPLLESYFISVGKLFNYILSLTYRLSFQLQTLFGNLSNTTNSLLVNENQVKYHLQHPLIPTGKIMMLQGLTLVLQIHFQNNSPRLSKVTIDKH